MTVREALHRLLDALPEEELSSIEALVQSRLPAAPSAFGGSPPGRVMARESLAPTGSALGNSAESGVGRLVELARLEPDWDEQGGVPPTAEAIAVAADLLLQVADQRGWAVNRDRHPFVISPLGNGGVQIEWRRAGGYFEVEVGPRGRLGYLVVVGEGADRRTEEVDEASTHQVMLALGDMLEAPTS